MSDAAPWEDFKQAPTPAPAAASTAASSADAPWLDFQKPATTPTTPQAPPGLFGATPSAGKLGMDGAASGAATSEWFGAIKDAVKKLYNAPASNPITQDLQTAAALGTSVLAPASAAVEAGYDKLTGKAIPSYQQLKDNNTYTPTDPNAVAKVNLVGTLMKPVGGALHDLSTIFTNDPEHQAMIADGLGYLIPGLKDAGALKVGEAATADIATKAPSVVSHPDVVAANDLAAKYNVPLTKGQQAAQAASDLPASQTAQAKALQVPYQLEAKAATQPTKVGQAYSNHFDTQQNTLASHVQDLADDLRSKGDVDNADLVENAIVEKSPGVNAVNGKALQKAVDKSDISDSAAAQKLNDLNDLSGIIDPPAKGVAIADPGIVQKAVTKFGGVAGAGAGAAVGGTIGHPIAGAEIGSALGSKAVSKFFTPAPKAGPLDINTLNMDDLNRLAKQTGLSTDQLAAQLTKQAAPAPAATLPGGISNDAPVQARPMGTVDLPQAPQAPVAPTAGLTAAQLLQHGIIDDTKAPAGGGMMTLTKDHGVRTRDVGTQVRIGDDDFDALLRGQLVNDPYDLGRVYRTLRGG